MEVPRRAKNVIIRTDGTVASCFPMYGATQRGNLDHCKFDQQQLAGMKASTTQRYIEGSSDANGASST